MGAQFACGNHLGAAAAFYCPQCDKHLCQQCAKHVWVATGFVDQCLTCQAMLQPIGGKQVTAPGARKPGNPDAPLPGPQAFLERVPDMLAYPFKGSVLLTVCGLALLTAPLMWATSNSGGFLALLGFLLILGLELMVYFTAVVRTAHGEQEMETPDFDNLFDDFIMPIWRYTLALLPIVIGMGFYGEAVFGSWTLGVYVLSIDPSLVLDEPTAGAVFIAGVVLLPLLTAIAAIGQSALAVLNPALWVDSLRVMWRTYPVGVAGYYAVLAFEYMWFRKFLLLEVAPALSIPLLGTYVVVVLSYIPMVLRARVLGQMCAPYLRDFE